MNKKWEIFETDYVTVKKLQDKYNISELLATCLVNRNIVKDDEIEKYLNPTRNDFYDPFLMPDMRQSS